MSYRHPLTALPCHALFNVHLQVEAERAAVERSGLAVLTIGVQGLADIEQTANRQIVDEVLEYVAHVIRRTVRHSDVVGHEADHCFFVLVKDVREHKVDLVARKLGKRLLDLLTGPVPVSGGERHTIEVSIGVAGFPHDGQTADILMMRSTEAANWAKRAGPNRFVEAQEIMGSIDPSKDENVA